MNVRQYTAGYEFVRVRDLARARSGDKGDRANIGVVVSGKGEYEHLERFLTAEVVATALAGLGAGGVVRYALPNLRSFNFVVDRALGGGASRSLRFDTQGKALAVALLELPIPSFTKGEGPNMNESLVLREDFGTVALLTLNRPERRNALSRALVSRLTDALSAVAVDAAIRAVVVTGAGHVFCAGMDLHEALEGGRSVEAEKRAVAEVDALADLYDQLHNLPKPVVAAINGPAMAGGAGLAAACDFVMAAESARIGYPEVLRGLVPAIVMQDLVRQVGARRSRDLVLSGRSIDANEAMAWGLVNRVVPGDSLRDEALSFAAGLSASGPLAVATCKRLLDEAAGRPRDLRGAAAVTAAVRTSEEAMEGLDAFLQRRTPRWAIQASDEGTS